MIAARIRGSAGLLLIEAAAVLALMMLMTAVLAPTVTDALDEARLVRARHDLAVIGVSVTRLVAHTWRDRLGDGAFGRHRLLVGPGEIPQRGTPAAAGWDASPGSGEVGLLNEHLLMNGADAPRQPASAAWRGPYVEVPVGPDPWGQRYGVNVIALFEPGLDMIAVGAGPDGIVEAPFVRDGGLPSGDDLIVVLAPTGGDW